MQNSAPIFYLYEILIISFMFL